jgi:hypothetical protein
MLSPRSRLEAENVCFRLAVDGDRVVVVDANGVRCSYLEWALANTDLTQEVFDHAKALLYGSGPALEKWIELAETK